MCLRSIVFALHYDCHVTNPNSNIPGGYLNQLGETEKIMKYEILEKAVVRAAYNSQFC